jgi:hypothetical protein
MVRINVQRSPQAFTLLVDIAQRIAEQIPAHVGSGVIFNVGNQELLGFFALARFKLLDCLLQRCWQRQY